MDKEKEIEQIAEIFVKEYCKQNGCESCDCAYEYGTKLESCEDYVHYHQMATKFYEVGYRSADEVRKKTAKEILQRLYDTKEFFEILNLAEKYGVEVDE